MDQVLYDTNNFKLEFLPLIQNDILINILNSSPNFNLFYSNYSTVISNPIEQIFQNLTASNDLINFIYGEDLDVSH